MANRVLRATDVTIDGNLTVTGTTTAVESANTTITDNIIVLNQDEVGAGVTLGTAGIEIDRGTADDAQLVWEEVTDTWQLKVGTTVTATLGTWTGLSDTPGTLTASKFIKVNAGGTALEFADDPHTTFVALSDTPGTFTANQYVTVNSAGTALEYIDQTAINTSIAVTAAKKALIYAIIFGG
tara:strand:+ start:52 stop:597 length:546 start_codon:yes stop_codon:yes gene_type:complete